MAIETLEEEVERLRAELEARKVQELVDLKAALADARHQAAHYKAEAQRNADVGREIATNYQQQVMELQAKNNALSQVGINVRRTEPRG